MAPIDSPKAPTEEMMRFAGGVGRVEFWRREERWDVMEDSDVEGERGGSEGVSRPCFGSERDSVKVHQIVGGPFLKQRFRQFHLFGCQAIGHRPST